MVKKMMERQERQMAGNQRSRYVILLGLRPGEERIGEERIGWLPCNCHQVKIWICLNI